MVSFEIIAFLVGHIAGWGEGNNQVTMKDLMVSGFGSALISLVLAGLLGAVELYTPISSLIFTGTAVTIEMVFETAVLSAVVAFIGTYWGYFTRVAQEQLQQAY
jgi:hypothetical protein